jgi:release factor glutamine methyltransferase
MTLTRALAAAAYGCWRPLLRRRLGRTVLERIDGVPLLVLPEVFNPRVFPTGVWLARAVAALPPAAGPASDAGAGADGAPRALDMGTGSGIGAVFAARRGYRVTAVDVNPHAVRCARINALLNGLEERIEVREGDLFSAIPGECFDLVLFNPPFFRGAPRGPLDAAWRSDDVIERFAAGLPAALAPGGRALLLLSSAGGADRALAAHAPPGLSLEPLTSRGYASEAITIFAARRIGEGPAAPAAAGGHRGSSATLASAGGGGPADAAGGPRDAAADPVPATASGSWR